MPATTSIAASPRRRWFQYSLRSLFIFVTVAGCGLGWLGIKMQQGRQQRTAVAALGEWGGYIQYDYQFDERGVLIPDATPPGPIWLSNLLGDDFFSSFCIVRLCNDRVTDSPYLVDFLRGELAFWKLTAPQLKKDWARQAGSEEDRSKIEVLTNRIGSLYSTLYTMRKMKPPECREVVQEIGDFWRSLPQLDKDRHSQIGEECDAVLKALSEGKQSQTNPPATK